jgi:hypothetical protein
VHVVPTHVGTPVLESHATPQAPLDDPLEELLDDPLEELLDDPLEPPLLDPLPAGAPEDDPLESPRSPPAPSMVSMESSPRGLASAPASAPTSGAGTSVAPIKAVHAAEPAIRRPAAKATRGDSERDEAPIVGE